MSAPSSQVWAHGGQHHAEEPALATSEAGVDETDIPADFADEGIQRGPIDRQTARYRSAAQTNSAGKLVNCWDSGC